MTDPKANAEPSMEEILASIRQIINQADEKPAETEEAPADPEPVDPRLAQVTAPSPAVAPAPDPVPPPQPLPPPPPVSAPAPRSAVEDILELTEELETPQEFDLVDKPASLSDEDERLLSEQVEHEATETISRHLTNALHEREAALPRMIALGNGDVTLESMVLELLRPMLKNWLDTHLPEIVEKIVRREVAKLVRRVQEDL